MTSEESGVKEYRAVFTLASLTVTCNCSPVVYAVAFGVLADLIVITPVLVKNGRAWNAGASEPGEAT